MTSAVSKLTVEDARRMMREHPEAFNSAQRDILRDKSYQRLPMGEEVAYYLRSKRKRLTASSYRDYESVLDKFARYFWGVRSLSDFEPPVGTERIEEFLDHQWGERQPRTYNKCLSVVGDFFDWQVRRGRLRGDPTTPIERAKKRGVHRTVFTPDQRRAIIAAQVGKRDQLALRLLLEYALRKGSLKQIRFQHFDHLRKRLTIFAKGGKVRNVPIPDPAFWHDLERLILDTQAEGHHFLMQRRKGNKRAVILVPDEPMGDHGLHRWWYRCLADAGVVAEGSTSGERMHKARHTAGQRLLDSTGNLKAVQKLLGHQSITTTGDIYTDWDDDQLAASLMEAQRREEDSE